MSLKESFLLSVLEIPDMGRIDAHQIPFGPPLNSHLQHNSQSISSICSPRAWYSGRHEVFWQFLHSRSSKVPWRFVEQANLQPVQYPVHICLDVRLSSQMRLCSATSCMLCKLFTIMSERIRQQEEAYLGSPL